jgi:hypothetical protein
MASSMAAQIAAQKTSNRSALPYLACFAGHREQVTRAVSRGAGGRLCVLGAGNCHDVDLVELSAVYAEIHLVDIDEAALDHAYESQPAGVRRRIVRHAPVDLSGLADKLDRWCSMQVQPEELFEHPASTCDALAARLPAPFDVVLSACVLTQMHWTALNVLSDEHPLFAAVSEIVTLTHLRAMASLTRSGGRAVLVTDVVSSDSYPLEKLTARRDAEDLLAEVVSEGHGIDVADPRRLAWMAEIDPMLHRAVRATAPVDAWLWQNGPERVFLVYAMELERL